MKLNNKGLTIIELLITLSVGSVVLMMLMGILSSTMLAKNEAEYINRLNNESFYINESFINYMDRSVYTSIKDISPVDEDVVIIQITHEYEVDIIGGEFSLTFFRDPDSEQYNGNYHYLIVLDKRDEDTNGLYFGPANKFNETSYIFDDYKSLRVNSENIVFMPESTINVDRCLGTFKFTREDNFQILLNLAGEDFLCASALIEIDLVMNYTLTSGNNLSPRSFSSTLFFQ